MTFRIGRLVGYIGPVCGLAWIRWNERGAGLQIKAPWQKPLFSERYGYTIPIWRVLGFRAFRLDPIEPILRLVA